MRDFTTHVRNGTNGTAAVSFYEELHVRKPSKLYEGLGNLEVIRVFPVFPEWCLGNGCGHLNFDMLKHDCMAM
jgi:hypothetical protein